MSTSLVDQTNPLSEAEAARNARLLDLLDRVSKQISSRTKPSTNDIKCLCSKKNINPGEIRVATHIDGVRLLDRTCDECRGLVTDFARIYCLGCKELLLHRKPAKLSNGFEYIRGRRYHVKDCPKCNSAHFDLVEEVEKQIKETPDRDRELRPMTALTTIEEIIHVKKLKQ